MHHLFPSDYFSFFHPLFFPTVAVFVFILFWVERGRFQCLSTTALEESRFKFKNEAKKAAFDGPLAWGFVQKMSDFFFEFWFQLSTVKHRSGRVLHCFFSSYKLRISNRLAGRPFSSPSWLALDGHLLFIRLPLHIVFSRMQIYCLFYFT